MSQPERSTALESPSLAAAGAAAFELKFLIDELAAQQVAAWASARLALDPHGDPALNGAYRTVSVYCDTPELAVYHRAPGYRRSKLRLRRYGLAPWTFLERKSKWGDRVAKLRSPVPHDELAALNHPMSLVDWPGHWFHRELGHRRLGPACRIAYERTAYVGTCTESHLRLTLDRRVRGILTDTWSAAPFDGGLPVLAGQVILELKFHAALPAPFKELVAALQLSPSTVSKYRLCRQAWALAGARREAVDA